MHLVIAGDSGTSGARSGFKPSPWKAAEAAPRQPVEPPQPQQISKIPTVPLPQNFPRPASSLDELLPPDNESPLHSGKAASPALSEGWGASTGTGYSPPPLPPPALSPPQGASWTLIIHVPGAGGYAASIEGLESGHPELDRWLSAYLRTVSFPSSPDEQSYTLRWNLKLRSERPE